MKLSNVSLRARLLRGGAGLLALATAQMMWSNLQAIEQQAHTLGAKITVVIATRDLPAGLTLTKSDIRIATRHRSQMPAGTVQSSTVALGAIVRVGLVKGAPIQQRNLANSHTNGRSIVPSGYRGVRVSDHAGLVPPPGTVVDILASYVNTESLDGDSPASRMAMISESVVIARGALVMSGAGSMEPNGTKNRESANSDPAVILRVKEGDVAAITFAQSFGEVSIVLAPLETACCE